MDFDYEEECKGSSDDIPADEYYEYSAAVGQDAFQLGFSSPNLGEMIKMATQ